MLARRGHTVRALVRPSTPPPTSPPGIEVVVGDLADHAALASLVRHANAVIHLVGIIVETGGATFQSVHVEGTRRLLGAAREGSVERFVHMSAAGARDAPGATPYHRTKWHAEELVRGSGLSHVVFRPSIISGRIRRVTMARAWIRPRIVRTISQPPWMIPRSTASSGLSSTNISGCNSLSQLLNRLIGPLR